MERFDNFTFDEVVNHSQLDEKNRWLSILSTLIGCQEIDEYKALLPTSFHFGLTPVEVKEMVYQATAYLGIGRVFPFLKATNEIFTELGIALPVQGQATTTTENRLEKGIEAQVAIFGEHMKDFYQSGDPESKQIHYWLTDNCFGDYYTRNGLDYRQRELITFCFLAAQGGCEPQLVSHAAANIQLDLV